MTSVLFGSLGDLHVYGARETNSISETLDIPKSAVHIIF